MNADFAYEWISIVYLIELAAREIIKLPKLGLEFLKDRL